ncbi:MAG: transposase [Patescibacteria group bacterium]|nr:transposase [Patescibacteria group bacterium]
MPYRYNFHENGYYHVYNRGVEKRPIFLDEADYNCLLSIFRAYLSPKKDPTFPGRFPFYKEIQILAFCLMPNHFHLLIKQLLADSLSRFMKCVWNTYLPYFNDKYQRVGPLFQGRFKGKEVENNDYLLGLTYYIHRNSLGLIEAQKKTRPSAVLSDYPYSSYRHYLGLEKLPFVHNEEILAFFSQTNPALSYQNFVEDKETNLLLPQELTFE